jgi:hypothetical protein
VQSEIDYGQSESLHLNRKKITIKTITPIRRIAMLKIDKLDKFLNKCQNMLEEHPQELKEFIKAMYDLVHIALYVGYIRGKEGIGSIDHEEVFNELFNKFLSNEWKKLNKDREEFFLDEDFFITLNSETLDLAERLFPIVMKLYSTEPIDTSKPIGRLVFTEEKTCEAEKR